MKIFGRFAPLFLLVIIGCAGVAWINLMWPFPGWFRFGCVVAGSFSAIAFLLAFVAARVSK